MTTVATDAPAAIVPVAVAPTGVATSAAGATSSVAGPRVEDHPSVDAHAAKPAQDGGAAIPGVPVVSPSDPVAVLCDDPSAINEVLRVLCNGPVVANVPTSFSFAPSTTDVAIPVLGFALLSLVYPAVVALGSGVLARLIGRRKRISATA